jgi:NAD(P)-dependent dehydrogenase (short-subunit alcohol dehydrogenase family)
VFAARPEQGAGVSENSGRPLLYPDLLGKSALVTGASSGLGAHFAQTLGAAGVRLWLAARRAELLEQVAGGIRSNGAHVETLPMDVSDDRSVKAAFARTGPVDIIINNAGIYRPGPALLQSEDDWDAVIDINLKGMFLVARDGASMMRHAGRGGSIVNVASILGLRQAGSVLPYAVSKAGVIQLTKVLALELARFDIRVNALAPGYFKTDINSGFWNTPEGKDTIKRIPQRRLGEADDLDGPLLLLASEASRYMTGAVLTVDGGHLVSTL